MDPLRPETSYPLKNSTGQDSPLQSLPVQNSVVEVVDCLSDTVVSVVHLDQENSNALGRLLLVAAAMCFVVFSVSFFQALSTASRSPRHGCRAWRRSTCPRRSASSNSTAPR